MQSVTRACRTVPNWKVTSVDPAAGEVGQYEEVIRVFGNANHVTTFLLFFIFVFLQGPVVRS